jgi:multidrug transporter EmrE-like cation transporter
MSFYNVFLLSLAEIFGDFQLENYATTDNLVSLSNGILGYAGVVYILIKSLRQRNVLFVNASWDGMSAILETLAAMIFLGETLKTTSEYIGLVLIISGLFFLYK